MLPPTYGCCVALRTAHHLSLPTGSRVVYAVVQAARCRLRWLGPVEVTGQDSRKRLYKQLNELAKRRRLPLAVALVGPPCGNCGDDRVMRRSQMRCHPKTNILTETVVLVRKDSTIQSEFEQIRGRDYKLRLKEEWDRVNLVPKPTKKKISPIAAELKHALRYCGDEARAHIHAALQMLASRRKRKKGTHAQEYPHQVQELEGQGQQRQEPQAAKDAPVSKARWWNRE